MKKLKSFLALLAAAALVFTLAACEQASDGDTNPFVGTWTEGMPPLAGSEWVLTSSTFTMNVYLGGQVFMTISGTYTYNSSSNTITATSTEMGTMVYTYEFSGDTLTLTDDEGEESVLTKQ